MLVSIKYLIVHHTERNNDFPLFVKFRHIFLRNWDDIGYHFLIGNKRPFTRDGKLYIGRPENRIGAHAFGFNEESLGICLIGNLDKNKPSRKQIKTLIDFLKEKKDQYDIPKKNILGHHELPNVKKSCPGKNLDMNLIRQAVFGQIELLEIFPMLSNKLVPSITNR